VVTVLGHTPAGGDGNRRARVTLVRALSSAGASRTGPATTASATAFGPRRDGVTGVPTVVHAGHAGHAAVGHAGHDERRTHSSSVNPSYSVVSTRSQSASSQSGNVASPS